MTRTKAIASYLGRFLEIRLRAFVYALFTLNGILIGFTICFGLALVAIDQYEAATKTAILMKYGL